jgi:tetratricopeptide (TPR) repeat protein
MKNSVPLKDKLSLFILALALLFQAYSDSPVSAKPPERSTKPGSGTSMELKKFLKLREIEDRAAAEFFFEHHPHLAEDSTGLARASENLAGMRFYEAAVNLAEQAVTKNSGDTYALATAAYVLNRQKNSAPAIKYINRAASLDASARNFSIMAEVYESKGMSSKSIVALQRAELVDKESFELARARSFIALSRFSKQAALDPLNIYLTNHPREIRALILRAEIYSLAGNHEAAIKDFSKVLSIHPNHTGALQGRADEYRHLKKWALGAKDAKQLLSTKTVGANSATLANLTLAKCLEESGDLKGALSARDALFKRRCQSLNIDLSKEKRIKDALLAKDIIECARIQNKLKLYTVALKYCDLVLAGLPTDASGLEQRAVALEGAGRLQDAVKAWTVLVQQHKNFPNWLEARARVYDRLGDVAAAKKDRDAASAIKREL